MNAIARHLGWAALAAAGLLTQACTTLGPDDNRSTDAQPTAGMRAYKDPVTGRFGEPPAGAPERAVAAEAAVSTSAESLTETPGQTPAGGVRLDLQGRFRSYSAATKDEEGRIKVHCLPAAPQP